MDETPWYRSDQFKIAVVGSLCAAVLAGLLFRYLGTGSTDQSTGPSSPVATVPPSAESPTRVTQTVATSLPTIATIPPPTVTPSTASTTLYLEEQGAFTPTDSLNYESGVGNINGQTYPMSLKLYTYSQAAGPVHVSFVLGRKYHHLQATVGVDDAATEGHTLRFQVFADGNQIFARDMPKGVGAALDLDVTNVYTVKFVVFKLTPDTTVNSGYGVFGDARVST